MQKIVLLLSRTQIQLDNGSLILTIYKSGLNVCVDLSSRDESGITALANMAIGRDMHTIMELFSAWDVNLDPFVQHVEEDTNAIAKLVRP